MIMRAPFEISSRLLPAVKIGDSTVSVEITGRNREGRTCYRYYIDTPVFEHIGDDLKSGCQGGTIQGGMESLLSFLAAAAESYRYCQGGRQSRNIDLFPPHVMEWAYLNADEISSLGIELEENKELITE